MAEPEIQTEPAEQDAVVAVALRNDFYRDNYRRIITILLLAAVIIFGLASTLIYMILNPPPPRYIAMYPDGRLLPLIPLSQPNMSSSALLQWANSAAIAAYTYSFVNYRSELQAASEFFTPDGWRAFLDQLKTNGNLDAVIDKKLIVSAVATQAPFILEEGELNGRYTWKVQMGMLITYQSASQVAPQQVVVTLLIQRLSPLSSPKGIGISQFIVSGGSAVSRSL